MTEQEHRHISILAFDLLIDSEASALPIDITAISKLYNAQYVLDNGKSLYENALAVSKIILSIFGLTKPDFPEHLAVRLLAPVVVLKELDIKSAQELAKITNTPIEIAEKRFIRYCQLKARNAFGKSRLEKIILSQFQDWIESR